MASSTVRTLHRLLAPLAGVALVGGMAVVATGAPAGAAGVSPTVLVASDSGGVVVPIEQATNTPGSPIGITGAPRALAITPDGQTAYVTQADTGTSITPIAVGSRTAGSPLGPTGADPSGIAITPDGRTAYVSSASDDTVTPITLATGAAGTPIHVGSVAAGIAITPDGTEALVVDEGDGTVTPIDLQNGHALTPIHVGTNPESIAITPNGATAYVTDYNGAAITPINVATATAQTPISLPGTHPDGIAITPDGSTAWVTNEATVGTIVPVTLANGHVGTAVTVGNSPDAIAITPSGATAYVAQRGDSTTSVVNLGSGTMSGSVATAPDGEGVAISPDQAPTASFTVALGVPGSPTRFNGSGSTSPVGGIASYAWNFGDGHTATTTTPSVTHTYAAAGQFTVTLTVTNTQGTSTSQVFTGQTVSRNGGPSAASTRTLTVSSAGYDLVGSDGGVFVFGPAGQGFFGSLPGLGVHVANMVGHRADRHYQGYYLVGSDGGVFAFGDPRYVGSLPGSRSGQRHRGHRAHRRCPGLLPGGSRRRRVRLRQTLPSRTPCPGSASAPNDIVGIAPTADDQGYWLVSSTGSVYALGDASYDGDLGGSSPTPIVGIATTQTGGYWLVGKNGSVFPFGDAQSYGLLPALGVSVADIPASSRPPERAGGYWLIGADGGIFGFNAPNLGSLPGLGVRVDNVVGAVPTA